jgi:alpha-N-arabinofuranosidase
MHNIEAFHILQSQARRVLYKAHTIRLMNDCLKRRLLRREEKSTMTHRSMQCFLLAILAVRLSSPFATAAPAHTMPIPSAVESSSVTVDAHQAENRISRGMYASFTEMMAEDVKRGLTAEMLHDRSFEQSTDYLGLPAAWRLEPDERNDNVGAIRFAQTTETAYPKMSMIGNTLNHSLRVALAPGDITDPRIGFTQGRLSVVAHRTYNGYIWAKLPASDAYQGGIIVEFGEDVTDGATYAKVLLPEVQAGGWHKYNFALTPSTTDRFAKLSFLFAGSGVLYLDQASLEPASARDQVRVDSEAMIAGLHTSFLRWPGGNVAQYYHWKWGVGPRDLRPVWVNKAWSDAPEPNDLGTDEYLAMCARLHIEPSITVNVDGNGGTAAEAANWVDYVNGPVTSKYGAMRAANGHPAPYGVKQWELGNEIFGGWESGHVTAEQYAHEAVDYARAMRAVDPSIRLIAVGEGTMPGRDAWNAKVLGIAGSEINYLAIHDYTAASRNAKAADPRAQMMARAEEFAAGYRHTAKLIAKLAPGRGIRQIVNEWNLFYNASVVQSMDGAVYASRMMNGFERDGATVAANCISDLLDGWIGGEIQASRDRIYGTAQYYAVQMYGTHLGEQRLHTVVQSPEIAPDVASVDAVASQTSDGTKLFVKLSNADRTHTVAVHFVLNGFSFRPDVKIDFLAASAPMERNSFADPDAVHPVMQTIQCDDECSATMPPDSVAVLTFRRR